MLQAIRRRFGNGLARAAFQGCALPARKDGGRYGGAVGNRIIAGRSRGIPQSADFTPKDQSTYRHRHSPLSLDYTHRKPGLRDVRFSGPRIFQEQEAP
jgi:hypothetical protein